ncbi:MAG TPA: hypothetical protein VKM72_14815 [Thermoanaerobaculia bacterium]|nr:hypothetical protein [Thermoanaerobaculia bacterium]
MTSFTRFDAEQSALLEEIGEALLRRQNGAPLSLRELGAIPFLERLLAETSGDADLIAHFEKVVQDPLRSCPIQEVRDWRARRGLDPEAKFDIVTSENLMRAGEDQPISRAVFYVEYIPLLVQAARAAKKAPGYDSAIFAKELSKNESKFWPSSSQKSAFLIKRLLEDLLYALMGMQNPIDETRRSAFLTKLGELRRVGNKFEPRHAEAAVDAFRKALDEASQSPREELEEVPLSVPEVSLSIGNPPLTTKREHLDL